MECSGSPDTLFQFLLCHRHLVLGRSLRLRAIKVPMCLNPIDFNGTSFEDLSVDVSIPHLLKGHNASVLLLWGCCQAYIT